MLDIKRMKRPTAAQMAIAIRKFYQNLVATTCKVCGKYIQLKE